jgi:PEP-CTERM motif-containing protein
MKARFIALVLIPGLLGSVSLANAATINFGSLSQAGTGFNDIGTTYSQSGFTFTGSGSPFGGNTLGVWRNSDPSHPVGLNTTSLVPFTALTLLTIAPTSGTFSFQSIDLAQYGFNQLAQALNPTFSVTFNGTQFGGGTVSQTFAVPNLAGSPVLSTYNFSGFTNLTQVSVLQGIFPNTGTSFQLDNLVVNSVAPVPEPSTWAMMILGFAGVGFMAYRRSRKTTMALTV